MTSEGRGLSALDVCRALGEVTDEPCSIHQKAVDTALLAFGPGRVQACEHTRVTWWPNGQECDACGVVVRVRSAAHLPTCTPRECSRGCPWQAQGVPRPTPAMPRVWCPEDVEDCGAAVHHSNCCAQGIE